MTPRGGHNERRSSGSARAADGEWAGRWPLELILVRHGESEGNAEGRLQGQRDYPLTALGQRQVAATAKRLALKKVAAVYSSPIKRALTTAEAIVQPHALSVRPVTDIQEYDFGELSGLTWPQIKERAPEVAKEIRSARPEYPSYPGEEGRETFRRRVCNGLMEIAARHKGDERVVVVTHAGPIAVFAQHVLGREYLRPNPFQIGNCSLTTIEFRDAPQGMPTAVLVSLNQICHLA